MTFTRLSTLELAAKAIKRPWHLREQRAYPLHPIVCKAIEFAPAADWQQLILEWPHVAADGKRLAFTRNEQKGIADLQEVTTPGKYLKRHWPNMADHDIKSFAALQVGTQVEFLHTTEAMIAALMAGPSSCMTDNWGDRPNHPYEAYAPKYGWHLAVRMADGVVQARALCNSVHNEFVRTYGRASGGYTQSDEELQAYLENNGYTFVDSWSSGTKLDRISYGDNFLAPYLDGDTKTVTEFSSWLAIDSDGDFTCDNTDGTPCSSSGEECAECGDHQDPDDMYWVGRNEDRHICDYCRDGRYTYVYGRRGDQYYIHDDNVVHAGDEAYDDAYLSDNDIVELKCGDYAHMDDAFCCPVDGCWYHVDDGRMTEDQRGLVHEDNVWTCTISGNVYSDLEDHASLDGDRVHPDHVPEEEDEDDEEEGETVAEFLAASDKGDTSTNLELDLGPDPTAIKFAELEALATKAPVERFCLAA